MTEASLADLVGPHAEDEPGDPAPWLPLALLWDGLPDTPGVPRDRHARPDLDTALALRRDLAVLLARAEAGS